MDTVIFGKLSFTGVPPECRMWNAECKMIVFSLEMIEIIGVADTIHSAFCIMNSALQRLCAAKLNNNLLCCKKGGSCRGMA